MVGFDGRHLSAVDVIDSKAGQPMARASRNRLRHVLSVRALQVVYPKAPDSNL